MDELLSLLLILLFCTVSLWRWELLLAAAISQFDEGGDSNRRCEEWRFGIQRSPVVGAETVKTTDYDHLVHWKGRKHLRKFMKSFFSPRGNLVCDLADITDSSQRVVSSSAGRRALLKVSFGCNHLFEKAGLGTGNFMAGLYAIRLAAHHVLGADVWIDCHDAEAEKSNLILPWLTGFFRVPARCRNADLKLVCNGFDSSPFGYHLYPQIKYELRRMAIALVGIPPPGHSAHARIRAWIEDEELHRRHSHDNAMKLAFRSFEGSLASEATNPLFPHVQLLDDAIVHFRCGDLMDSKHPRFGFLKFPTMASRISIEAKSIGIVTQPFRDDLRVVRTSDSGRVTRRRCKTVVLALKEYLSERFPKAQIRIHNSINETIALTYARMIVANQTVTGISTFGVFAAIASFGTGYTRLPDERSATNQWLLYPERLDHVMTRRRSRSTVDDHGLVLMEEPDILMVSKVRQLWRKQGGKDTILHWFRNE